MRILYAESFRLLVKERLERKLRKPDLSCSNEQFDCLMKIESVCFPYEESDVSPIPSKYLNHVELRKDVYWSEFEKLKKIFNDEYFELLRIGMYSFCPICKNKMKQISFKIFPSHHQLILHCRKCQKNYKIKYEDL